MALRQRKAKDTILPLHNSNQEESASSSSPKRPPRSLTPPPPVQSSRKLRGGDYSPTASLVYRVYIPIIGVIILVVGVAYLAIGGGDGRHHKLMEVMPKRHYHEHTAGKLKVDAATGDHHHLHHDKSETVKPKHEENTVVKPKVVAPPAQQQHQSINPNDSKSAKPVKIRCLDGDGDGYLNDDYCDCLDGSDESKTSACSHLTVSQSKFHCADGTAVIYSSRVHDGIKDCLDGSDELLL